MKKIVFITIAIFLIVAIVAGVKGMFFKNGLSLKQPKALIQNHSFNLLVVKSDKEKEIGLSKRESLPKDSGMLFRFEKPGYYSFWMKNMQFPIDIIFIKGNKIVTIYSQVKPPTDSKELAVYQPISPADTVLEINAGLAKEYGFKNDMEIKYENLGN